jgi:hypothetical protein
MKRILLAAVIPSFVFCFAASAAIIQWANVGPDWATGSDWLLVVAPANDTVSDIAAFGSAGTSPVNPTIAAPRSVNGVDFLSGAFSYTISGSALTIGTSGIGSGAATSTETFSNNVNISGSQSWNNAGALNLNGTLDLNNSSATPFTLTLQGAGATIFNGLVQNSFAGSTGNLTFSGSANGSLTLANANTYNGLTLDMSGRVNGTHDGAFGLSNVSLTSNTAQLALQGGITNDYISNSATLSTSNGSTIVLNFLGTDIVGAFVVNGVQQPAGVYSMANEPGLISGTGTITVVPEPATSILLGAGLLIGAPWFLRRRKA